MTSYRLKLVVTPLILVSSANLCLAQGAKPGQENKTNSGSQEIYFNADAREVIQPTALAADTVSATSIGDVLTLLFNSAKVSLQNETDPLSAAWVGTVRVPTRATGKSPTSYLQHLRGAVDKSEGTKVTLIVSLGGKTFTTEYPYGIRATGDVVRAYVSPVRPRPSKSYTATIVILVERRDPKTAVLVSVDSLDVEAKAGVKSQKK